MAIEEEKQTGEYIRPIVLLQAQPKSQTKETLTVEVVRQSLIDDFKRPEEQIAVATGQTREIDDVDLFARDCPIRFIITVAALKKGGIAHSLTCCVRWRKSDRLARWSKC